MSSTYQLSTQDHTTGLYFQEACSLLPLLGFPVVACNRVLCAGTTISFLEPRLRQWQTEGRRKDLWAGQVVMSGKGAFYKPQLSSWHSWTRRIKRHPWSRRLVTHLWPLDWVGEGATKSPLRAILEADFELLERLE